MDSNINIPHIPLGDEVTIPRIIRGTWQLAGGHGSIERETEINNILTFVNYGFTAFDTADIYQGAETLLGKVLQRYVETNATTEPLRVHTKFVPDRDRLETINRAYVEEVVCRSMERLNVPYLDLVQFHWWDYDVKNYTKTFEFLGELRAKGIIKQLGVTNFNSTVLQELIDTEIPIASCQLQYSLLDQRPDSLMIPRLMDAGITPLFYGTLAGGWLSSLYLGLQEMPPHNDNRSMIKYGLIINDVGGWISFQGLLKALQETAIAKNTSIASLAMAYVLAKHPNAAIIVGSRSPGHIKDLITALQIDLSSNDLDFIDSARKGLVRLQGDVYDVERDKGGSHAGVMRYNLNQQSF